MPTSRESIRCCEIENIILKKKQENSSEISCIINHDGFESVCLNVWVLQTAYFTYGQNYGDPEETAIHK